MFFCELCKMFKNIFSFDRTPQDDCFLCLSVNFEKFFRTPLSQSTSGKLLFHVQVAEFQPPNTVKKLLHRCFSSIFYKIEKQLFEGVYLKSLKAVKKLICNEQQDANLQLYEKKLTHPLFFFCLDFLRMDQDFFFRRGFESVRGQFS